MMRLIVLWLIRLFAALLSLPHTAQIGVATRFSAYGDSGNPTPYAACVRRDMDDARDRFVAHRTLPCMARVLICRLKLPLRCTRAQVGDRGPARADIDLNVLVARDLGYGQRGGFSGREHVLFAVERSVR